MNDRDFLTHILNNLPEEHDTVLDCLKSRLLKSCPEELTVENTQAKLQDQFEVIKGRSSKKEEKEKKLLTKIKDALQNANLTNEQTLAVFQNILKGHVEVVINVVIKKLSVQTRKLIQTLLKEIKIDFWASTSCLAHGTTQQSFPGECWQKF